MNEAAWKPLTELQDRVAVITGASRGIGAATAREFARHRMAVMLLARTGDQIDALAAQINAAGGRAIARSCDVSDYQQVVAAIEACRQAFGRLDILVNNAAVIEPIARLADSDPQAWAGAVDINVKGVYFGLRAAIPVMLAQGGGTIVNLSSGAATGALEGWSHYCSTKAAVLSLTRCADLEYRAQGIRVVGLSPGTVAHRDAGADQGLGHQPGQPDGPWRPPAARVAGPGDRLALHRGRVRPGRHRLRDQDRREPPPGGAGVSPHAPCGRCPPWGLNPDRGP
ncbi:MAG: SDR family oxidoreductase [Burkholderiaceae bacterium]